jgi:hypothetical protein
MAIAIFNAPPGGSKALPANTVEKIVGIQLNAGNNISPFWTVFGKVVVNNPSPSPVTVQAQLVVAPATLLDTSMATVPANGLVSVSLEGVAVGTASAPICVEINCKASAAANAELGRLIAISVNPATVVMC